MHSSWFLNLSSGPNPCLTNGESWTHKFYQENNYFENNLRLLMVNSDIRGRFFSPSNIWARFWKVVAENLTPNSYLSTQVRGLIFRNTENQAATTALCGTSETRAQSDKMWGEKQGFQQYSHVFEQRMCSASLHWQDKEKAHTISQRNTASCLRHQEDLTLEQDAVVYWCPGTSLRWERNSNPINHRNLKTDKTYYFGERDHNKCCTHISC